ncbi:EAL domain-containing protein [Shewanella sp. Isolate7]|uniref:EAL domain-containing protein n=1 Tax=Shewanella sp. Isolate7 TaxID=2908528 RepID=UPI001EFCFA1D|nr:EAL domain-containing protein [Shewanella sp. Isolate7]MCG9719920.1 EAL domain-containing protein [Shewanella sp. Isolate7]
MSSMLNRYSLSQKLILLATIPMLLLLIFGSLRMFDLIERQQTAQRNALGVMIIEQTQKLIYALQNERGLSAGFIASKGERFERRLQTQRRQTEKAFQELLDAPNIANLHLSLSDIDRPSVNLQQSVDTIHSLAARLEEVRQDVDRLKESGSFSFYSEFTQHLLVLISQIQSQVQNTLLAKAYNDLIHMLKLQELAGKDRDLLNRLLSADSLDYQSYLAGYSMENELNDAFHELLSTTSMADLVLIQETLDNEATQELALMKERVRGQVNLILLANRIRERLGYGGLIDHFLDYLLGGEASNITLFEEDRQAIQESLRQAQGLPYVTSLQRKALEQIANAVSQYREAIYAQRQHKLSGNTVPLPLVREEQPMLEALSLLQHQPPAVTSETWWALASESLSQMNQASLILSGNIALLVERQGREALGYLVLGIMAAMCNFLFLIVLGRLIVNNLVTRIGTIAALMQRMAQNTQLELSVPVDGRDEVAKMAMALNAMLSERQKANRELSLASAVYEYCAEGIVVTDKDNLIEAVNPAFTQITGYTLAEVKGRSPAILNSHQQPHHFYEQMWQSLKQYGKWQGEIWNKRKNGQIYPEYLAITVVKDDKGRVVQHIGLFLDISNRKKYEQDIWYKSNYDALTNLPNRQLYTSRLSQMLQLAEQRCCSVAVLFIDLDRFKYINDIYGHAVGDELLQVAAARLEALLEQHDFVARLSGDEFVVVMGHTKHQGEIEQRAQQILQHLSSPFGINRNELLVSASVGISCYPSNGTSVEVLTRNAETAMYQAKQDGRNCFGYFSPDMNNNMLARITLEQSLRSAVLQHEFCLHYQPIVDTSSGEGIALEALLRWRHPQRGLVPPDEFIPIAEETGLIEPIGEWVIQQALRDLRQWHYQGIMINMAINVSGRQLAHGDPSHFACMLNGLLQKYDVAPQYIHIEITESMLMADTELSLAALTAIRHLGVEIYLDDFGTGYSSLSYLKQFPISVIKIDKSFVDNMLEDRADANLIKAIITMGQSLDMRLVAEGVESEPQRSFLQGLGCDFVQGYLVAKPMPVSELEPLLQRIVRVRPTSVQ